MKLKRNISNRIDWISSMVRVVGGCCSDSAIFFCISFHSGKNISVAFVDCFHERVHALLVLKKRGEYKTKTRQICEVGGQEKVGGEVDSRNGKNGGNRDEIGEMNVFLAE